MQEDDGIVASEFALLDVINKARHRFGSIDGVEEDTLRFGNEFEGIDTFRREVAVSLSNVVICILNVCFGNTGVQS